MLKIDIFSFFICHDIPLIFTSSICWCLLYFVYRHIIQFVILTYGLIYLLFLMKTGEIKCT